MKNQILSYVFGIISTMAILAATLLTALIIIYWINPIIMKGMFGIEYSVISFSRGNPFRANEATNLCTGGIYSNLTEYSEFYVEEIPGFFDNGIIPKKDYEVIEIRNSVSGASWEKNSKWYCLAKRSD